MAKTELCTDYKAEHNLLMDMVAIQEIPLTLSQQHQLSTEQPPWPEGDWTGR